MWRYTCILNSWSPFGKFYYSCFCVFVNWNLPFSVDFFFYFGWSQSKVINVFFLIHVKLHVFTKLNWLLYFLPFKHGFIAGLFSLDNLFFFLVNEFFHLHVIHVYTGLLFLIPVYVFYWNVSRLVAVESDILQNVLARLKYCEEEEKVFIITAETEATY